MKRNEYWHKNKAHKHSSHEWNREHKGGGFRCSHCKGFVIINDHMGTVNRNHCNLYLWSKHVDDIQGDRASRCLGGMEPIALTFKHEGFCKQGELMIVHLCLSCQKLSINRIARDDPEYLVKEIFERSLSMEESLRNNVAHDGIRQLETSDRPEVMVQLYGTGSC